MASRRPRSSIRDQSSLWWVRLGQYVTISIFTASQTQPTSLKSGAIDPLQLASIDGDERVSE